jgi:DNA-binding PadR family transcriptional regulator
MTTSSEAAIDAAKKGSADLLILALVEHQALHGYEIARQIEGRSGGTLVFTLASLYATLYRLEERGLLRGRWVERAGRRRRRCYRITDAGRKILTAQREAWVRFITALTEVAGLRPA